MSRIVTVRVRRALSPTRMGPPGSLGWAPRQHPPHRAPGSWRQLGDAVWGESPLCEGASPRWGEASPARITEGGFVDTGRQQPHVIVLGGGFGGVGTAVNLRDAGVDVTLVDRNDYHTFQPLL